MRVPTLKSYTKSKMYEYLKSYNKKEARYKWLLEKSITDQRLAEVSQAYYMCLKIFDKAESFSTYTFEHYATYEDFLNSDQKYVSQFNIKRKSTSNAKKILKLEIVKLMQQRNITQYQVATKYLHTSQSNVSQFFNKNNDSALSYEKLKKLYMELLK